MAGITTHVLDTASGVPGEGMRIDFSIIKDGKLTPIKSVITNAEGRTSEMILKPEETQIGEYELLFYVRDYFAKRNVPMPEPAFIDLVPIRFSVFDLTQHYHIPVLVSPWSCSTYRGS